MSNLIEENHLKRESAKLKKVLSSLSIGLKEAGIIESTALVDRTGMTPSELLFLKSLDKIAGAYHSLSQTEIEIIEAIGKKL